MKKNIIKIFFLKDIQTNNIRVLVLKNIKDIDKIQDCLYNISNNTNTIINEEDIYNDPFIQKNLKELKKLEFEFFSVDIMLRNDVEYDFYENNSIFQYISYWEYFFPNKFLI